MSKEDFELKMKKKMESGILYYITHETNIAICSNCDYRGWKSNTCRKFWKPIKRVNHSKGGFYHLPCEECLKYKITQQDINYFTNVYNRNRKHNYRK